MECVNMKIKKFNFKSISVKLGIILSCLVIAFIGFEIRGFMLFDPIVPYTWPLKLTEFIVTHTTFNNPFSPPQKCEDFNTVVRLMGESFPKHTYGQAEFYSFDPADPNAAVEPVIERGVAYDEVGIIKWRYKDNEPYIAFELSGNWTNHYDNENGKGVSVQEISDKLPKFRKRMESSGFVFSESNNIPLYRYPEGSFARKVGFTKKNHLYHFTIVEEDPPYDPLMPKEDLLPELIYKIWPRSEKSNLSLYQPNSPKEKCWQSFTTSLKSSFESHSELRFTEILEKSRIFSACFL